MTATESIRGSLATK